MSFLLILVLLHISAVEFTVRRYCGCQKFTHTQKAIRQIYGRKIHSRVVKHKVCRSHRVMEAGRVCQGDITVCAPSEFYYCFFSFS